MSQALRISITHIKLDWSLPNIWIEKPYKSYVKNYKTARNIISGNNDGIKVDIYKKKEIYLQYLQEHGRSHPENTKLNHDIETLKYFDQFYKANSS